MFKADHFSYMRYDLIYCSWEKLFCHLIYSEQCTVHVLQCTVHSAQFTVHNLQILSCIRLFYSRSTNRVQTQCFASVSPNDTVRIPGLASWTFVLLGFTVDCE
jgi:hypothetical protein